MNLEQIRAKAESEITTNKDKPGIPDGSGATVHALETRIALRNCGVINPESISDYVLRGNGYSGLSRALEMSPADVVAELRESGLRGRGGAGFSTAQKWQVCRGAVGEEKYVICDAIDTDPKACPARLILENDPHVVLEGILIGAYAVGAWQGFICINAGYSTALERFEKALVQMRDYKLLGEKILDSDFSFGIEIREVPSSLVMGEETALIRFLEEKQPMPYMRPPYPAVSGLNGNPTLINNAETFSHVSAIFQKDAAWYAGIGSEAGKGTKIVTLAGDIKNQCTAEVPLGTTLRTLVTDIGGGTPDGKDIKAVKVGGPTGLFIGVDSLDMALDFESISKSGGMVGSGTIEVFAKDTCAVEAVRDALTYLQAESCGKCVFCREGSYQMADILSDITENNGKLEDINLLLEIGEGMKAGSICGLGRMAPNPVLSSLALFRDDYDAHINGKKCPVKND